MVDCHSYFHVFYVLHNIWIDWLVMKIQVTEKHILKGIPENCEKCAIALALQDALEGYNLFDVRVITDEDVSGKFKFSFRESVSCNVYQWTDYTISQTDAVNVNRFINEFDLFGYDKGKQESIPCRGAEDVKPFTFELGGEIERNTVMSGVKQ